MTLPLRAGIEQEARDLGVGLGLAEIEFLPVVLAQRLGIDAEHGRDIGLRNAGSPQAAIAAHKVVWRAIKAKLT